MEGVSRVAKIRDTPTGGERTQHTPQEEAASTQHKTPIFSQKMALTPSEITLKKTVSKNQEHTKGSNLRPSPLKSSEVVPETALYRRNKTEHLSGMGCYANKHILLF